MDNSKTCEKCGKEFGCEAATGKPCWCMDYSLSEKQLADLKKAYNDCLCPDCIKQMSDV